MVDLQLLHLDASGDPGWTPPVGKSNTTWYVLAGISLDEKKWQTARTEVEGLNVKYFKSRQLSCSELRYSSLISGQPPYDALSGTERVELANDVFALIMNLSPTLFASAINKTSHRAKYAQKAINPKIWALQLIAPRFDKFLARINSMGMMIMDAEEVRKDKKLKDLIQGARERGIVLQSDILPDPYRTDTRLPNVIGNCFFEDSRDSPLIQLVDFCSHAIWNHFERGKSNRYNQIYPLFDKNQEIVYGLKIWNP